MAEDAKESLRQSYEAAKISFPPIPNYRDVVNEASAYKANIQEGVVDATDPGYTYWEYLKTPVAVLGVLVLFWFLCWWLCAREDEGHPNSASLYGHFLTFQLYSFPVNVAIFFTPLLIWFAQGKCIRLLCSSIETIQNKFGTVPLLRVYVGLELLLLFNTFLMLVQKESNPRGRTIKLFHEGLKPIRAWVSLKWFPGGAVSAFLLVDLVFDFCVSLYYVIEGVYQHLFHNMLEVMARFVCLGEIVMHVVVLLRMLSLINSGDLTACACVISWVCFYLVFSAVCLSTVLAGMYYSHLNRHYYYLHSRSHFGH